jgi:hypothetical protein
MAGNTGAPPIVTTGLVFAVDAANKKSHARSGTAWTDLVKSRAGTKSGTYSFEKGNSRKVRFTNGYTNFSDNADYNITSDFTLNVWFKPTGTSHGEYPGIFCKDNSDDFGNWGIFGDVNGHYIRFGFLNTSSTQQEINYQSIYDLQRTDWVNYQGVFDASETRLTLYRNGVKVAESLSVSGTPATNNNGIKIASRTTTSRYFNGEVAICQLYNTALTEEQVKQNYQNLKSRFIRPQVSTVPPTYVVPSDYVLFLDLNDSDSYGGTGTVISDLSPDGNDLTLVNSPTYVSSTPKHLSFDGANDYGWLANLNYGSSNTISEMSVFAWIRTDRADSNTLNSYDSSNWAILDFDRSEVFNVYLNGHGQLSFSAAPSNRGGIGSGNFMDIVGVDQLNDNAWHLIGITYSVTDQEIVMYVDGAVDETFTANGSLNAMGINRSTRYGIVGDGSEASSENGSRNNVYYDGDIASILFYEDTALTAQQASDMWNGQKSTFGY